MISLRESIPAFHLSPPSALLRQKLGIGAVVGELTVAPGCHVLARYGGLITFYVKGHLVPSVSVCVRERHVDNPTHPSPSTITILTGRTVSPLTPFIKWTIKCPPPLSFHGCWASRHPMPRCGGFVERVRDCLVCLWIDVDERPSFRKRERGTGKPLPDPTYIQHIIQQFTSGQIALACYGTSTAYT